MGREELLRQLHEYRTRWTDEAATVDRFVAFVASHADCFARTLAVGHVTGSAWVVDRTGRRVL
ncbi:MAG TPA: nucleoside triphosphate hydrolase, partial [Kiritimatiellia bacterium]|nr:nucleoside triphosphate hydrolase [Kiritimatiellia bacterium]